MQEFAFSIGDHAYSATFACEVKVIDIDQGDDEYPYLVTDNWDDDFPWTDWVGESDLSEL